jgi:hypothetical protein
MMIDGRHFGSSSAAQLRYPTLKVESHNRDGGNMINRTKALCAITLLLFCAVWLHSQDIFKIADYGPVVRPNDGSGYIATVVLKNGNCRLLYESMGFWPTILGAYIDSDHLDLLIKARWTGAEEISPGEKYPTLYYMVRITAADVSGRKDPLLAGREVEQPSTEFAEFQPLLNVITVDTVNVRDTPAVTGKRIGQLKKGSSLTVLGVADHYDQFDNRFDFWYHIKNGSLDGWVFGYYLDGKTEIQLPRG